MKRDVGIFAMIDENGTMPLRPATKLPYTILGEPEAEIPGYVKIAETSVEFTLPTQAEIFQRFRETLLRRRAEAVERNSTQLEAIDAAIAKLSEKPRDP